MFGVYAGRSEADFARTRGGTVMKLKKRLAVLLALLCLLCGSILPFAVGANPTVYLLAVGNKMFDPPGEAWPVSVDGVIYIPYTVFDRNATNSDLGVYCSVDPSRGGVLTLFSQDKRLVFTVQMGICVDQDENPMNFRAVRRGKNDIPYVPASAVCNFFGLHYSFLPTSDRGTLIRIADDAAISIMSDSQFMAVATASMLSRYNEIIQGLNPQPSPSPTPSIQLPVETPLPTQSPGPDGKEGTRLYLAVDASEADGDLTLLFPNGVRVLFLFTPESLPGQSALVRKAVAAGHSVGLIVNGTEEEIEAQLALGNELLSHIARIRTHIVAGTGYSLSTQGRILWQPNVTGSSASAGTLLSLLPS